MIAARFSLEWFPSRAPDLRKIVKPLLYNATRSTLCRHLHLNKTVSEAKSLPLVPLSLVRKTKGAQSPKLWRGQDQELTQQPSMGFFLDELYTVHDSMIERGGGLLAQYGRGQEGRWRFHSLTEKRPTPWNKWVDPYQ